MPEKDCRSKKKNLKFIIYNLQLFPRVRRPKSEVLLSGFTLIELLVVIAIIGVLATLAIANFNAARQRSRDAVRKADLKNIQTALALYYNDFGYFPNSSGGQIAGCGNGAGVCTWGVTFATVDTDYMSTLPTDPLPGVNYVYNWIDPDTYTLSSCLENESDEKGTGPGSGCTTNLYTVSP